jgi:hypothetical protein
MGPRTKSHIWKNITNPYSYYKTMRLLHGSVDEEGGGRGGMLHRVLCRVWQAWISGMWVIQPVLLLHFCQYCDLTTGWKTHKSHCSGAETYTVEAPKHAACRPPPDVNNAYSRAWTNLKSEWLGDSLGTNTKHFYCPSFLAIFCSLARLILLQFRIKDNVPPRPTTMDI